MRHEDDLELAEAVLRGERAAFERFFEAFYAPVRALAARHAPTEPEARALCERMLSGALRALERYEGRAPLAALVLAAARPELPRPRDRAPGGGAGSSPTRAPLPAPQQGRA